MTSQAHAKSRDRVARSRLERCNVLSADGFHWHQIYEIRSHRSATEMLSVYKLLSSRSRICSLLDLRSAEKLSAQFIYSLYFIHTIYSNKIKSKATQ